jgi:SAM-dependent methyltransferase
MSQDGLPQDEASIEAFAVWLKDAPPLGNVVGALQGYRAHLLAAAGLSEADADGRIGGVQRRMRAHREIWPLLFDRIYASDAPSFRTEPSALLLEITAHLLPGRALDVCMGEGRNALYLARQGWDVTGFDVSEVGLGRARERAVQEGLELNAVNTTHDAFAYGVSRWGLIALFYAPVSLETPEYAAVLADALEPGGLVVIESFASAQTAPTRRPVELDPDVLRRVFSGLDVLRLEDGPGVPEWDQQQGRVVRFVAAKPG